MISKSGVHLPDTTYSGNPIAWKDADDPDEELRRLRDENAKLRELVKDIDEVADSFLWEFIGRRMLELGIEVSE